MNSENVMPSESSQSKKAAYCLTEEYPERANPPGERADRWVPGAGGGLESDDLTNAEVWNQRADGQRH